MFLHYYRARARSVDQPAKIVFRLARRKSCHQVALSGFWPILAIMAVSSTYDFTLNGIPTYG